MDNKVLIIGADHHNTLGVVESLAEKGIKPYVLIYENNPHSFVLHSKHIADGWVCQSEEDAVTTILDNFTDKENKTVLIATNDEVACLVDRNHARLDSVFFLPIASPAGHLELMMKKEWMTQLAKEVHLNVPTSWSMTNGKIPVCNILSCEFTVTIYIAIQNSWFFAANLIVNGIDFVIVNLNL